MVVPYWYDHFFDQNAAIVATALCFTIESSNMITKTAIQQIEALKKGKISALALLEKTIQQAGKVDSLLNPFALKLYSRARQVAGEADKQLKNGSGGALCGLPITIKDSQFLAGYPCANGSKTLSQFIPSETCRAVELLEQAGAVIFAKTTCPEFSLSGITHSELYGTTSNPWNLERTCGGSSGGAAVAVASGLGALSLGGDGGGSIRIPAGFCGIVGFKPSFGMIPREPCFPSWHSIVSYGPMARTVADVRLMYSVLNPSVDDYAAGDSLDLNDYPLITSEDLGFAPVNDDVRLAFRSVIKRLRASQANLIEDNPALPSSVVTWAVTATFDAFQNAKGKVYNPADVGHAARGFLALGGQMSQQDFDEAHEYRDVIRNAYDALFERCGSGILITPTLGCEAFPHGSIHPSHIGDTSIAMPWLDWAGFLYDANLAGLPACAIPMGLGAEGLPLSLQILGPAGSDDEVLRVAEAIEALIGWQHSIVVPSTIDASIDDSVQKTA
ncbi:MAG: Asp-tRNA(Asn)/Glu-tRNA(Gln) amidotransferase A subunit family amidase [Gammaproteobacteria bacterium]|jgi:Asp-tRNA(Asn)/Glu-tRNA(Gln) amidotransferase A subunit family amidase